jgi:hypothetical protein
MAALVDCAASPRAGSDSSSGSKGSQRHSVSGFHDQQQQQHPRRSSCPGQSCGQQAGVTAAHVATLQALAECCAIVLQSGPEGVGQQAQLLASCACRALAGSMAEALCVLLLLRMVLRHVGAAGRTQMHAQLQQVGCVWSCGVLLSFDTLLFMCATQQGLMRHISSSLCCADLCWHFFAQCSQPPDSCIEHTADSGLLPFCSSCCLCRHFAAQSCSCTCSTATAPPFQQHQATSWWAWLLTTPQSHRHPQAGSRVQDVTAASVSGGCNRDPTALGRVVADSLNNLDS